MIINHSKCNDGIKHKNKNTNHVDLPMKILVFDIDETLGSFSQLGLIVDAIASQYKYNSISESSYKLTPHDFKKIVDLYPEYIRPNMISILNYVKREKMEHPDLKIMLYTNNQRGKEWVHLIKQYFEDTITFNLFDNVVNAFKINGKQIELERTSNQKKVTDLTTCCKLPDNVDICYLDNTHFSEMIHPKVYYIYIKSYIYNIPLNIIIDRFMKNKVLSNFPYTNEVKYRLTEYIKQRSPPFMVKTYSEYLIDKIISKKIIMYIKNFFHNRHHNPEIKRRKIRLREKIATYKNHSRHRHKHVLHSRHTKKAIII